MDLHWAIAGRFLTEKSLNFVSMKNVLALVWRPVCGMCMKELQKNLYLFQFFHQRDVDRVLKKGSWSFEQNHFLCMRLKDGEQPTKIPLFMVDFWVQVHDLPCGFMSEKVAIQVGNYIGTF